MTDIQEAHATTALPVAPITPCISTAVHEIDESFYAHIASEYWAWRAVFELDGGATVGQHPDYVLTELKFSREPQHRPPCLITCHKNDKCVAAAVVVPKSIAGEKRFGPAWDLQGYRLAGNRLIGDTSFQVQASLLQAVRKHLEATRADFLIVEDIESEDPLVTVCRDPEVAMDAFRPAPPQTRHRINLPESVDGYWKKFSSKSRNTLRRKVKQFGECRLERITTAEQLPGFLAAAQQVAKNSWQSDLLGLHIHNDDFELQLFTMLATQGSLRTYLLWKEDVPVSFCIGTQHNGVFDYEEVGYDREFSRKSPGLVMVVKMLEDLFAHAPPRVFDFGGGDAEYKRQFGNVSSESGHTWFLRPGVRSRLIVAYLSGRRILGASLRSVLARTGLIDRVRQWTRKGLRTSQSAD